MDVGYQGMHARRLDRSALWLSEKMQAFSKRRVPRRLGSLRRTIQTYGAILIAPYDLAANCHLSVFCSVGAWVVCSRFFGISCGADFGDSTGVFCHCGIGAPNFPGSATRVPISGVTLPI